MPASPAKPNAFALDITDHPAVIDFCKANKVDLVVVGPDAPIAAGIVDDLNAAGFKAFGPSKAGSAARKLEDASPRHFAATSYSDRGL